MQRYECKVAGEPVTVNRVENEADLDSFRNFIRANQNALACDSETTGLEMYRPDFRVRLVQFGNAREAFVVPVEYGGRFVQDVQKALRGVNQLVFQNGGFDLQVFDKHLGVSMEELWPKVKDTKILAHLIDSRPPDKGGTGISLEDLVRAHIDGELADNVKGLMTKLAKEHKTTKARIWSLIDLDHPEYNLYAGMDTIFAARLWQSLLPKVPRSSRHLIEFERKVAEVCSYMERTGFLLDEEYTRNLSERLKEEADYWADVAREKYGIDAVNSGDQVADALEAHGVRITGRTETGKRKVDKALLDQLMEGEDGPGKEIARAVYEAKRARKWRKTWVEGFLDGMDSEGRCHAHINPLQARTGRMSITGIPAQTLPSSDWMIRRCFIAEPDQTIVACDYQTQELRVLAALAEDRVMQKAFRDGEDLHQKTADAAGVDRKVGKTTNFAKVYGSGPRNIAEQCGIPLETAKAVVKGFEQTYPGVAKLGRKLQAEVARNGYIVTPSGRRLLVDPDRGYAALNYLVQSTSRDVTCRALIRLHEAGATKYLRLPVHDEVVCSVPSDRAEEGAKRISKLLAEDFHGVHIGSDHEVGKRSWGSLYGSDE